MPCGLGTPWLIDRAGLSRRADTSLPPQASCRKEKYCGCTERGSDQYQERTNHSRESLERAFFGNQQIQERQRIKAGLSGEGDLPPGSRQPETADQNCEKRKGK